jgi:hypothetical protein
MAGKRRELRAAENAPRRYLTMKGVHRAVRFDTICRETAHATA